MDKKTCECGRLIAPGARKYCPFCQAEKAAADRKSSVVRYHRKLRALPQVRECKQCGKVAFHAKTRTICTPCHLAKKGNKKKISLPEDELFKELLSKAKFSGRYTSGHLSKTRSNHI